MKFELKPKDLKSWKYWVHLVVLAFVVLILLQLFFGNNMLTIKNVIYSVPLLAVGDIVAHTLLKID